MDPSGGDPCLVDRIKISREGPTLLSKDVRKYSIRVQSLNIILKTNLIECLVPTFWNVLGNLTKAAVKMSCDYAHGLFPYKAEVGIKKIFNPLYVLKLKIQIFTDRMKQSIHTVFSTGADIG